MPSVANMMGFIAKLESPHITVYQERCVLVRNRNADCLRCAEVCTSGCISWDGERLEVLPEKCIGCGTCATACPTCALEAHDPNDDELALRCREAASAFDGIACIACMRLLERAQGLYDADKVVSVECLGRVEEALLTELAANGTTEIVLVHGSCESCGHATGFAMAKQVCETERQLLEAWESPVQVRLSRKLPSSARAGESDYDADRRAAFRQGGAQAAKLGALVVDQAAGETLGKGMFGGVGSGGDAGAVGEAGGMAQPFGNLKVMDDGTLPHFIPDRRDRLLDALASMGDPKDAALPSRLWGRVSIDVEACTSCRMCATFCPTGAIQKFDDADGTMGVEHRPGDCVQCGTCASICPVDAIELAADVRVCDVLDGTVERFEMRPLAVKPGGSHTIWKTMQSMMKTDQVFER